MEYTYTYYIFCSKGFFPAEGRFFPGTGGTRATLIVDSCTGLQVSFTISYLIRMKTIELYRNRG